MQILKYTKSQKEGFLQGFADISLPSPWGNFVINGVKVFEKNGSKWCALPQRATGEKDDKGKEKYFPVVKFEDRDAHDKFQAVFLQALNAHQLGQSPSVHAKQEEIPF